MGEVSFAADERVPSRLWRLPVAHEVALCTGLAALVGSLLVWLAPAGGDLAAHEYQRSLFMVHGFTLWDNYWYAGRYAFVGYSVLYYPLAALLGIQLLGVLTVTLAAAAFALILDGEWGRAARWSSRAFAVVWPGVILAGEFPFALGAALALLSLLALQRGRRWTAAVLVVLVLASSPVAFVLLVVALLGIAVARPHALRAMRVPALAVLLTAAAELVVMHLFPSGTLEFPGIEGLEATAFAIGLLILVWGLDRARDLRGILVVYLLTVIAVYVIPTGLGHDIGRLRQLALPLALLVAALRRWRPLPLALAAVILAGAWNIVPLAGSWADAAGDRSASPAVWKQPVEYLHAHLTTGYRVEAVDTSQHWPALYLARADIPLVRGWFRQDDRPVAGLLYGNHYTPAQYVAWLRRLGVQYVVLSNSPTDFSSRREAKLIRSGDTGLKKVFATREIAIYAVPRPQSIVTGPGRPRILALRESRLVVRVSRGGTYSIAVRWSPYWRASTGCLAHHDGMLRLRTRSAATVRIGFDIDTGSLFDAFAGTAPSCRVGTG
ncbi:MAG TPA: hypothetical protein VF124_06700 [Gaiellaceae bacterium]